MRDPFIAVDAGTDIRAPGLDPDHLHPRWALDADELEAVREESPLSDALPVLRKCLGSVALDAAHVVVLAAPIHDPASGALLGVVDISGPMRTAHPHSLALVMAAAEMAEDVLRFKLAVEEHRMRMAYLSRTTGAGTDALIGSGGRVLLAHPADWIEGPVGVPPQGGLVALGDGRVALAEPLEDAWVLTLIPERSVARPQLRLHLLGRAGAFDAFAGPLLPESEAPRVAQARDELEGALRRAAFDSADGLGRWLQTEPGRDDPSAMDEFLRRASRADPHRALVEARRHALERRWGLTA
jgi:hypothetical protein